MTCEQICNTIVYIYTKIVIHQGFWHMLKLDLYRPFFKNAKATEFLKNVIKIQSL